MEKIYHWTDRKYTGDTVMDSYTKKGSLELMDDGTIHIVLEEGDYSGRTGANKAEHLLDPKTASIIGYHLVEMSGCLMGDLVPVSPYSQQLKGIIAHLESENAQLGNQIINMREAIKRSKNGDAGREIFNLQEDLRQLRKDVSEKHISEVFRDWKGK